MDNQRGMDLYFKIVNGRFAYVDLLTKEAMEKVISRSEENFDGRNLLIKNGKSFEGRPAERKQRYQVKTTTTQGGRMGRVEGGAVGDTPTAEKTSKEEVPSSAVKKEKSRRKEEKVKRSKSQKQEA